MIEYDNLIGNRSYSMKIDKLNNDLIKKSRLFGLIVGYNQLIIDKDNGIKTLSYWGVKVSDNSYSTLKSVENKIKRLKSSIKIESIQLDINEDDNEDINYENVFLNIQNNLGYHIDFDTLCKTYTILVEKLIL